MSSRANVFTHLAPSGEAAIVTPAICSAAASSSYPGAAQLYGYTAWHLTRIATRPYEGPLRCCGVQTGGVSIDALALQYEQAAWEQGFLAQWPAGSEAHTSYWARLQHGPTSTVEEAVPGVA